MSQSGFISVARRVASLSLATFLISCVPHQKGESASTGKVAERNLAQVAATEDAYSREEAALNPSQALGRRIWYNATGGNFRYHTYTFPQRVMGRNIKWGRFLNTSERSKRFDNWGLINDPDCCTPGDVNCPKTKEETYGFDYCPGDDKVLGYLDKVKGAKAQNKNLIDASKVVGAYRDPACDEKLFETNNSSVMGAVTVDSRQNPCDLGFGTSTGALGFRKFPNPRFDEVKWLKLNGNRKASWDGFDKKSDDASIEPPFLIGVSCGSCHISFDPVHPPADANHPAWGNIKGTVGNQYIKNAVILGSGFDPNTLEWQSFIHEKPGATDTSAVPNDQITNPGTINAIINIPVRPKFRENVTSWKRVPNCTPQANNPNACWRRVTKDESVFHILKGGEDSIGAAGAVQRVYFNIGTCAEECWLNHLTNLRSLAPSDRNYGQTSFDIGQCRADCPAMRAIEDRIENVFDFLSSARPSDLKDAVKANSQDELTSYVENRFGGHVENGKKLFVNQCATCHSSQKNVTENVDFTEVDLSKGTRKDWMGNDEITPIEQLGTFPNRALHTNHEKGHVWEEYASNDYQQRAVTANPLYKPYIKQSGPGYMRNISLLSVWAFAPFLHNNAVGPEMCAGNRSRSDYNPFIPLQTQSGSIKSCTAFDPSVESRLNVFDQSVNELLTAPEKRRLKVSVTDVSVDVPLIPSVRSYLPPHMGMVYLRLPAGQDVGQLGSIRFKDFVVDLVNYMQNKQQFRPKRITDAIGDDDLAKLKSAFDETIQLFKSPQKDPKTGNDYIVTSQDRLNLYYKLYGNAPGGTLSWENTGHNFGTTLTDQEKKDLKTFLSTL